MGSVTVEMAREIARNHGYGTVVRQDGRDGTWSLYVVVPWSIRWEDGRYESGVDEEHVTDYESESDAFDVRLLRDVLGY